MTDGVISAGPVGSTPPTAVPGTPFATPLAVTVRDAAGNPLSGLAVTFTAPASGAGGTFSNSQTSNVGTTDASGIASVPFTANSTIGGPYNVAATAGTLNVQFALSNQFSACDVGQHGAITLGGIEYILGEALGTNAPGNDLNGDRVVNMTDVQIVLKGFLTMTCVQ